MKKEVQPRKQYRLWVLMTAIFTLILSLTVGTLILTFRVALQHRYQRDLRDQLKDGLLQLEQGGFDPALAPELEQQGVHLLLLDDATGEALYRDPDGMPAVGGPKHLDEAEAGEDRGRNGGEARRLEPEDGELHRNNKEETVLLEQVAQSLGAAEGSFFTTDLDETGTRRRLESKFLFLCGRSAGRIFCLYLPVESTNAVISLAIRYVTQIGVIAWALTLPFLYFLSKRVTRPHRRMADTAAQIARMDFSQRCPEALTTELNDLSRSINTMADSLESNIVALQQANRQLQVELEAGTKAQQVTADLIANLSHDLKTPIAIISGYAEGLREGVARTPEKQQTYYDMILRESERMQLIVARMLTLGRMESGETPITPEDFDVTDLLNDVLAGFERELERQNLSLDKIGPSPTMVHTDYECARQSLMNYVQNAVFHINHGTKIEVRLEDRGEMVRVCVANSSAPISEEEGQRIWEKLYRGDSSRQRHKGEMGLGLSIVKGNMERLGHPYGFYNDEAFGGVVFWLELPKAAERS